MEILDWNFEGSKFNYPGMVIIDVPGDGSCFFHALVLSMYKPYQLNKVDKIKFVRQLRKNLADALSLTEYKKISNGKLIELSREMPEVSLQEMKNELDSSKAISNIYNEFISDTLNRDIYLLDYEKKDVYMTGTHLGILYKGRASTVLIINKNHYELIGIINS